MKPNNSWENFWKSAPKSFDLMMQKATRYFAERYITKYPVTNDDVILDYGCGPGNFIQNIASSNAKIIGLDISKQYIELCEKQFPQTHIKFYEIQSLDFLFLKKIIQENKVNKLVVLSVLQYFPQLTEVENLLEVIHECASENEREIQLLIADILPENHSIIRDGLDVGIHAIKKNYIITFTKFIFFTLFQGYSKSKKNNLLQIPTRFFTDYAQRKNINIEIIPNITLHSSRYSVNLKFK